MIHFIDHIHPFLLFIEKSVFVLLVFLGLAVAAVYAWRLRGLAIAQGDPGRWIAQLSQHLDAPLPAIPLSGKDKGTLPGRVVRTGLANFGLAPEALEKVFAAQESAERRGLERGLSFLGTVGSNAPFLGLTGTVIGILVAFQSFAATGGKGGTQVMLAISHALAATAVGLVVAIPAVVCYNHLRVRVNRIIDQSREVRDIILARSLHKSLSGIEV